jgi:tetratricopeptide (TPR) repeat protein
MSFANVFTSWIEKQGFGRAVLAGVLLGLSGLVKPNALLFVPVAVLWAGWIAYRRRARPRIYLAAVGLFAGAALAVAPATLRNNSVADDFVLVSANLGVNLFIGNNDHADGLFLREIPGFGSFHTCYDYPAIVKRIEQEEGRPLRYSEVSAHFVGRAWEFIKRHPGRFIELTIRRALLFWGPAEIAHNKIVERERSHSTTLRNIPGNFAFIVSSAVLGLVLLCVDHRADGKRGSAALNPGSGRTEATVLILCFVLTYFVSYLPFFSAALYRVPLIPFLVIPSAYAIHHIGQDLRRGRLRRFGSWTMIGAGLYLLAAWPLTPYDSPGEDAWRCHRAKLYMRQDRLEAATVEVHKALALAPKSVEARDILGAILTRQGEPQAAIQQQTEALQLAGDDPARHVQLGVRLCKEGKLTDGILHFRKAILLSPDYATAHAKLAKALVQLGRMDEAVRELRRAVKLKPHNAQYHDRLGVVLSQRGQLEEGVSELKEAIREDPTYPEAYANLAVALKKQGKMPGAVTMARKAVRLEPKVPDRHCLLGNVLFHQGEYEEAMSAYREALRIDPQHRLARTGLRKARMAYDAGHG